MNNVLVGIGVTAISGFVSILIWNALHDISIKILCYLNKNYVSVYNVFDGRIIYDERKNKRINKYKEFFLILIVDILIVASLMPVFYLIGCVVNG